ncbi:zinc transporter ZntB [Mangrovibacterium diazotrophicum]|uniref:Zinc transporter n=1 Tax=Mangrovibacterium diazotrophicum TaxID=1261403 RepID=A0A419W736_9BACT|nr:zinc transporter ZntB [Mangrovibacterium diazotrophicum]RKD91284.1 zinc transporter [Mangrovibacterium diazotrophicum]
MKQAVINAFYVDSSAKKVDKIDAYAIPALKKDTDYIWLQLDFSATETRSLVESLHVNEFWISALVKDDSRPRVEIAPEELLLIVRGINLIKGEKPENMISVRIMASKNLIITTQKKKLNAIQSILEDMEQNNPPKNTGDFIVRLNERLVFNMSDVMEDIEEAAISMEELVMEEDGNDDQSKAELYNLRRQIIQIKRFLIPQRDALNKLQIEKTRWMTSKQQLRLREVSDYLMRYLEMLEAARELASVSQETLINRSNEQINNRMYLLSIIAALFLPLSFFTGLLGVNLSGIPHAENHYAFSAFVVILLVVVAFQFWFFRKNKWL